MGDCTMPTPIVEADLIAAATLISKALETKKSFTDKERKTLAHLSFQLSTLALGSGDSEEEQRLNDIRGKIEFRGNDRSWIWDGGPDEANHYLKSVNEVRKITEVLERRTRDENDEDDDDDHGDGALLKLAHGILQTAMSRLKEEFVHLLVREKQPLDKDDMNDAASIISTGADLIDDGAQRVELVHPDVIPDLRIIASLMFDSGYGRECSQAFANARKEAQDDCLSVLELEKLSVWDVLIMEHKSLNIKIGRWARAMRIFVRAYLPSEKLLCDRIFGGLESVSGTDYCFVESSRATISQLLNFGEAISVGPRPFEKLVQVLDMYEVLTSLTPDINSLYYGEAASCLRIEFHNVLKRLGECAKTTFHAFENEVANNVSPNPFQGGGVHNLTTYAVDYIRVLVDHEKTLNEFIFKGEGKEYPISDIEEENNGTLTTSDSPTGIRFRSLMSVLESKLEEKSKLYDNESLRQLFLMNNIHYMGDKVNNNSELKAVLGDQWVRENNLKFQRHGVNYERVTWSLTLALMKCNSILNPDRNMVSRALVKKSLHDFYVAFKEVYNSQSGWSVWDDRLREDLRISISTQVIQAYRTFVGRFGHAISEKHIKYSADDLEDFLLDLFEGSRKLLPTRRAQEMKRVRAAD